MTTRLQQPELNQELRLLYTFENWMSLVINLNLTFGNVLAQSGLPLKPEIFTANRQLGAFFAEELKRVKFKGSKRSGEEAPEESALRDMIMVAD